MLTLSIVPCGSLRSRSGNKKRNGITEVMEQRSRFNALRSVGGYSNCRLLVCMVLALIPFGILVARFNWICDDAYISFRYARNLASGIGLRYNSGESPPVEGYTNFLWVVAHSLVERLGADPTIWSRVFSVASAIMLLKMVGGHVQHTIGQGTAVLLATLVFGATLPTVFIWSTGGLASVPTALFLFGAYDRLLRNRSHAYGWQAGAFAVIASLLRADALVSIAFIFALAAMTALLERRRQLLNASLVGMGLLVLCTIGYFTWRYSYYGDWLPNTARIKAFGGDAAVRWDRHERGLKYVASYFMTVSSVPLVAMLGLAALRVRESRRTVLHSLLFVLGTCAYAVRAGGDFMAFGRFFVPAMPFLMLIFAATFARLGDLLRGKLSVTFAAVCVVLSLLPVFDVHVFPRSAFDYFHFRWSDQPQNRQSEFRRWVDMDRNARDWVVQGKMLRAVTNEGDSIVRGGIGAIGYYSGLHVYDTFGLTNLHWKRVQPQFKRKSPGHDREMKAEDFLEFRPTYLGLLAVVDEDSDRFEVFGGQGVWESRWEEYRAISDPEILILPPGFGFQKGKALLVLRTKNGR